MIGFIIWIIGVVLCVKAVLEINEVAGRRREETISCNYHPAHKLDWNLMFTTSGEGKTCLKY